MAKNRDLQSLMDIEHAAREAIEFLRGTVSEEDLGEDTKTQSAVVFQLLIIGEATKRISKALRNQHPDVPWSLMAGMRDNMIHEYDDIDVDEVYKTVKSDLPSLLETLQPIREGIQQLRLEIEDESL